MIIELKFKDVEDYNDFQSELKKGQIKLGYVSSKNHYYAIAVNKSNFDAVKHYPDDLTVALKPQEKLSHKLHLCNIVFFIKPDNNKRTLDIFPKVAIKYRHSFINRYDAILRYRGMQFFDKIESKPEGDLIRVNQCQIV